MNSEKFKSVESTKPKNFSEAKSLVFMGIGYITQGIIFFLTEKQKSEGD